MIIQKLLNLLNDTSVPTHDLDWLTREKVMKKWLRMLFSTALIGMSLSRLLLTQRSLAIRCVPCAKIKTPTSFYPLKKARSSRGGNYSFEFCLLHAANE